MRPAVRIAAAGLLLLAGCASVPEYTYFTMAYALLPSEDEPGEPLAESLRIRDLAIVPAYDKDKIVYRFSPYEFQYYNYKLWAVKPNRMVTGLIVRHIEHADLFRVVSRDYGESRPQYELSGVLQAIEELDSGDQWFAHLAFSLRMTRFGDNRVVWTYRADAKKRVYNKAPVYVVKALSELLEQEMARALDDLRTTLKALRERSKGRPARPALGGLR